MVGQIMKLYELIVIQLTLYANVVILVIVYNSSQKEENEDNVWYKIVIILGMLSFMSGFLLLHSAILNLRTVSN
jgi:protein-S-isoprenylcysteine O-methyltransferase Ste14